MLRKYKSKIQLYRNEPLIEALFQLDFPHSQSKELMELLIKESEQPDKKQIIEIEYSDSETERQRILKEYDILFTKSRKFQNILSFLLDRFTADEVFDSFKLWIAPSEEEHLFSYYRRMSLGDDNMSQMMSILGTFGYYIGILSDGTIFIASKEIEYSTVYRLHNGWDIYKLTLYDIDKNKQLIEKGSEVVFSTNLIEDIVMKYGLVPIFSSNVEIEHPLKIEIEKRLYIG